jgi:hypothetical protein
MPGSFKERAPNSLPAQSAASLRCVWYNQTNAIPRAVYVSPTVACGAPHVLGRSPAPEGQYNLQPPALTRDARARCDNCGASLPGSSRKASAGCSRSSWPRTLAWIPRDANTPKVYPEACRLRLALAELPPLFGSTSTPTRSLSHESSSSRVPILATLPTHGPRRTVPLTSGKVLGSEPVRCIARMGVSQDFVC